MDVQKELGKWKSEYVKCNTPEELADHKNVSGLFCRRFHRRIKKRLRKHSKMVPGNQSMKPKPL